MIPLQERNILRELAKSCRELAETDENRERINRIKAMHGLKPVRPPVWIDEIPWHEMDIEGRLVPRCESDEGKKIEDHFRKILYRWEYIRADMVVEDVLYIRKTYTDSGIGLTIQEETASGDNRNHIVSHHYRDQLDTEKKVEALKLPVITAHPEADQRKLEELEEIFRGILPVKLRGHEMFYCPWDDITQLRGVENCLLDMMDNPELIHKTIKKFTEISVSRYTQMADLGLLDFNIPSLHCTPPYTDELPAKDYTGGPPRLKDIWFRGMAQIFVSASPAMHEEFDLRYMAPFMEQCGLSYYGCCEPLDKVIPFLKGIKNMRKIGVSPWANVRSCAEQIGGDYVLARKPNPALVSGNVDPGQIKAEISETLEACIENKCPFELVLKDISTVGYKPQNLINWTKTVQEVIDRYYGAAP
ncbi:MAG: hypothetical protein LBQ38_08485 [Spirochaetaceae bacterium]|jgi:hypothetical protein|nr:hypothetical protein [Spirochaetaceae bacterium]